MIPTKLVIDWFLGKILPIQSSVRSSRPNPGLKSLVFMSKRIWGMISWVLLVISLVLGCNQPRVPSSTTQSTSTTLTVSAATSLQEALKAVGKIYQVQHPSITINYNFASSGTLTQQIQQGAPVDALISANQKFMDGLANKGLLSPRTRQNLLRNKVVLIAPSQIKGPKISGFKDLAASEVKRITLGQPETVPAGQYGKEVLTALNLYDQLQPKTVFAKDVRQVLSYVETGNVDAGIVYVTDAKISGQVRIVAMAPDQTHQPIIYPGAVLKETKHPQAAKEYVEFLSSSQAQKTFRQYGFIPITQK